MKIDIYRHNYKFKFVAGTSRGSLTEKPSYFIVLKDDNQIGIGECSLLPNLSYDDNFDFEDTLKTLTLENWQDNLLQYPSIRFGLETAIQSLYIKNFELFNSKFVIEEQGIPINGLIWMGSQSFMSKQIDKVLKQDFQCLKMKIGALNWQEELSLLKQIRSKAPHIELRVDANGAFSKPTVFPVLEELEKINIHSIEQPIKPKQWEDMAIICEQSPIPIALDEELIGLFDEHQKQACLDSIKPQYIILKPGLLGGLDQGDHWIELAEEKNIGWWATSALEGNIGLNSIAQWVANKDTHLTQGLGTGSLYTNNIPFCLSIDKGSIYFKSNHQPSKEEILKWLNFNTIKLSY